MGEEAERAETVVDGDDDRAVLHQLGRVVVVALAGHQRAAVDPHHDGQAMAVPLNSCSHGDGREGETERNSVYFSAGQGGTMAALDSGVRCHSRAPNRPLARAADLL